MDKISCFRLNKLIGFIVILALLITLAIPTIPVKALSLQNLEAIIRSDTLIQLKWPDTQTGEESYIVEKKTDYDVFEQKTILNQNSTTYYDYAVSSGYAYTYRIKVVDVDGNTYVYTNEVTVTSTTIVAPSTLSITSSTTTSVDLSWTYDEGKGYQTEIQRNINGVGWEIIAKTDKGITAYTDKGLSENVSYYYRIRAVFETNVYSLFCPGETGQNIYTQLGAPSGIYAFAATPTQIYIVWTDNSNESTFTIERKKSGETAFTTAGTVEANTAYFLDSGLDTDTKYIYRVKAVGTEEENVSEYSDEVLIRTVLLEEPSTFSAVSIPENMVELKWDDNSSTETGFEIWRKTGLDVEWSKYALVGRNVTDFKDKNVLPDTVYYYRIRSVSSHKYAYSAFVKELKVWTVALEVPSELQFSIPENLSNVVLTWKDNSDIESGFKVERKTGYDGEWSEIAVLPSNSITYTDKSAYKGVGYIYRIKIADNKSYNSAAYSEELEVNIGLPKEPTGLKLEALSSSEIKLTWLDNSDNELGFLIERKVGNQKFEEVTKVAKNTATLIQSGLVADSFSYRLRAYNRTGNSGYSNSATVSMKVAVNFVDVNSKHWAKKEIDNLASRGIFTKANGILFNPDESITKGEFVRHLVKVLNLSRVSAGTFSDVKASNKYYKEIMTAKVMGIISGDSENCFYPEEYVKREQIAVMVFRALKAIEKPLVEADETILDGFPDKYLVSPEALTEMTAIFSQRIMIGLDNENEILIAPQELASRAQAAVVLYNMLQ